MRQTQDLTALLQNPEYRRAYQQEKLIAEATELVAQAMRHAGKSRSQLASELGRSRAYVTQILSGSRNLTLRTWANTLTALGFEARLTLGSLSGLERQDFMCQFQPELTPKMVKSDSLEPAETGRGQESASDSMAA